MSRFLNLSRSSKSLIWPPVNQSGYQSFYQKSNYQEFEFINYHKYKYISFRDILLLIHEFRTANQRSLEIWNFARYLISALSLVGTCQGEKERKERIKKEIKMFHIWHRIFGFRYPILKFSALSWELLNDGYPD